MNILQQRRLLKALLRKAQPTPSDVHISRTLTNLSIAYQNDPNEFIADKVFPVVPVQFKSDSYWTFDKGDMLRDEAATRAPGTESAGGGFQIGTANYSCVVESYHKDIDEQTRANADAGLSLDNAAVSFVMQKLLLRRERRWSTNYFGTGIWGNDVTPGTLWDAAGKPRKDVDTAKITVKQNTGLTPNTGVITPFVLNALRDNADVRDQFKYVSADSIDLSMLARYFGLDRILLLQAVYATTVQGQTTATSFVGGKHMLVCYTPPAPSLMLPSAGYIFSWAGLTGSQNSGVRMKRIDAPLLGSERIEGDMAYDMKKVAADCGYFLNGVVS